MNAELNPPAPWRFGLAASGAVCISALLVVIANGHPAAVVAVPLVILLAYGIAAAPLRILAAVFVTAGLLFEDTRARPFMDIWDPPTFVPGKFLYDGLEKTLGVPGLKIFGIEAIFLVLVVVLSGALALGRVRTPRPARPLLQAAGIGAVACIALELWGIARGGNLRFSMLQFRPILFTSATAILFAYSFSTRRDARLIINIILVVGMVRAFMGIYFWRFILAKSQLSEQEIGGGSYVTTHADTILWVVGLMACLMALFTRPSAQTWALNLTVSPILMFAVIINNRRLAFVALALSVVAMYAIGKSVLRMRMKRAVTYSLPFLLIYGGAAWSANGVWAKPVQSIKTILWNADSSADMREIENYNLVITAKRNPIIGMGFGHEYIEEVRAHDITNFLEAYRYLPHNSLLWLMGAAGVVGFCLIWMLLAVAVFLAVRVYRAADSPTDEVAAVAAITSVIAYAILCFGDIGVVSWMNILVFTLFAGLMGGRATAIGAWPSSRPTSVRPP